MELLPPGGADVDIAVLFADVRGSTNLGERLGDVAFAALMNQFYRVATEVLLSFEATIDKLVGDEVMALFIPGFSGLQYRRLALRAAEHLVQAMGYGEPGGPWLPLGVGVHGGLAFVGSFGSSGVTDFTALGDTVNIAARLRAEAAAGEIVVSEALYHAAGGDAAERRTLLVRGKTEPLEVRIMRPGQPTG